MNMSFLVSISLQEKVNFSKNLAVMLKSGVPVDEALSSLAEQTRSGTFRKIISRVKNEIQKGTPLSEAFAREEKIFGMVFVSFVRAGEASGTLQENLAFFADWLERSSDLKKEVDGVLLYPKLVLGAAVLIGGGLTTFTLPRLVPLFEALDIDLPLTTRILLAFSVFLRESWLAVLLLLAAVFVAFRLLNRLKPVRRFFHFLAITAPFFGGLAVQYQLALLSFLFSSLFRSGLPLSDSLRITSEAATNLSYQDSIRRMKTRIDKGTALSQALEEYPRLYPKTFTSIVAVGEKSGTLDNSFAYLSEFYSKEVNNTSKRLPSILEPLVLLLIAVLVGFVAFAIIMPIYELTSGLSR